MALKPGDVIEGRFRLDDLIGQGGMGQVWRGTQISVGRCVAVKTLLPELMSKHQMSERFMREARVLAGISHPNVVRLIDFGHDTERDLLYLVMEYVQGVSVDDLRQRGLADPALALEIIDQIVAGLSSPHQLGIIHRDIKPDNFLVVSSPDGSITVKVLDFGIALPTSQARMTNTGQLFGTPLYMSPEQIEGRAMAPTSDFYSLGAIAYEMISGHPPFWGHSVIEVIHKHISHSAAPLSSRAPAGFPREIGVLIDEMLAKRPEDRPQTARALRGRIEAIRIAHGIPHPRLQDATIQAFDEWLTTTPTPARSAQDSVPLGFHPSTEQFPFPAPRIEAAETTTSLYTPPSTDQDAHAPSLATPEGMSPRSPTHSRRLLMALAAIVASGCAIVVALFYGARHQEPAPADPAPQPAIVTAPPLDEPAAHAAEPPAQRSTATTAEAAPPSAIERPPRDEWRAPPATKATKRTDERATSARRPRKSPRKKTKATQEKLEDLLNDLSETTE